MTYTSSYRSGSQYEHLNEKDEENYQVHIIMAIEVSRPRNERVPGIGLSV